MKESVRRFILNILENEFGHKNIERPDLYNISSVYQKENGNFWLAFDGDKLVGTIGLESYTGGRGYIRRMYVDSAYRGKGVAQELLFTLVEFARLNGFTKLYLATTDDMVAAQKFYIKEGFKQIKALPQDLPNSGDTIFYKMDL